MSTGRHGESINLRLDVGCLDGGPLEPSDINLDIEVTDAVRNMMQSAFELGKSVHLIHILANNSIIWHSGEVLASDNVTTSCCGNENVSLGSSLLHGCNLESGHGSLESVNGIDFGNDDSGSVRTERLGAL